MRTYAQMRFDAHHVGGETQTEATASMSAGTLSRWPVGGLRAMLADLTREANACTNEVDYDTVRDQMIRVRVALHRKERL